MEIIKIVLMAIVTLSVVFLIIYVVALLLELRNTIKTVRTQIIPVIHQVKETLDELRPKANDVITKIGIIAEEDIKPLAHSVKDITGKVNESMNVVNVMVNDVSEMVSQTKEIVTNTVDENMAKFDVIVDAVEDMVERTHEVVTLYQQKAVIPAYEVISLWAGIKKGFITLFKRGKEH